MSGAGPRDDAAPCDSSRVQIAGGNLWRHTDFLRFWAAQSASQFGSEISLLAIPLVAALTLDATALEMGFLTFAGQAPALLVGLFAGVWADRFRRRPILVVSDLTRFALLLVIPILAFLDRLQITHLLIIVFLAGLFRVFFDVAYQSYLPSLVGRAQLPDANGRLTASRSIAQFAGPGLAGGLVQIASAPFALVVDAVTFLISALLLRSIRTPEAAPTETPSRRSIWPDIREGLQTVLGNSLLRSLAGCTATANLSRALILAVFVLYATRTLDIGGGLLGLIFAIGSIGALSASVLAAPMTERFGIGRTIIAGRLIAGVGVALIPIASGSLVALTLILMVSRMLLGFGSTIYNINQVSLRQMLTSDRLLGRMNASMRFIIWGTIPIGGLLGGVLGTAIGLRPTLAIGALGMLLSTLWVGHAPIRTMRSFSEQRA